MSLHIIKHTNDLNLISPLGFNKDYWFWKSKFKNFNHTKVINKFLKLEKDLITKYPAAYDGHTNLPNSVTARHTFYNLFSLKNTGKEIDLIKNFIKLNIKQFLTRMNILDLSDLWIISWLNVLRKGEKISKHSHYPLGRAEESFISGHFCVNVLNTNTYYLDVGKTNEFPVKNEIGQLSLFPSYLVHWSDIQPSNEPRITIAFDVYFKKIFIRNNDFIKRKIVIPLIV